MTLREAIDAGLRAFCEETADFDMSAGMRRSCADYIMAQPLATPQPAEAQGMVEAETLALAVFHALYGKDADPFQNPESYDFCEKVADAALSATLSPQAGGGESLRTHRESGKDDGSEALLEQRPDPDQSDVGASHG